MFANLGGDRGSCRVRLAPGLTKCLDHEEVHHMYQFGILFEGEPDSASLSRPRILVEVTGPDAVSLSNSDPLVRFLAGTPLHRN